MNILLDHCVPRRLKRLFPDHQVNTTREMGWETLQNGKLLDQAQISFDVLLTADQNMDRQQNLKGRSIAVIIMEASSNDIAALSAVVPELQTLLPTVEAGNFYRVSAPVAEE